MNFELESEHEMLRDSVREFFERELPEERIREIDRARRIPRDIWRRFAKMGWQGISVPTDYGGSGGDVSTAAVFCEELARRFPSLATDWLLVSMTARVTCYSTATVHFVPLMVWKGLSEGAAASLLGAFALANLASHFVLGWIADRVNKPKLLAA